MLKLTKLKPFERRSGKLRLERKLKRRMKQFGSWLRRSTKKNCWRKRYMKKCTKWSNRPGSKLAKLTS